jgi:hypothetical protein
LGALHSNLKGVVGDSVIQQIEAMAEEGSAVLTEQEAAVYDRQIRVWGVEAQRRWVVVCRALEPGHDEGMNLALAALTANICRHYAMNLQQ